MKRAFFVLGCEGSGTRMLAQAFIAAGCRGSADHVQPLDNLDFSGEGDLVFRRSLPHGGAFPDLSLITAQMNLAGCEVCPVFIHRCSAYLAAHQLRTDRTHFGEPQAPYAEELWQVSAHQGTAWLLAAVLSLEMGRPLSVVSYEAFVELETVRRAFFMTRGLPSPTGMEFYNANADPRYAHVEALPW